MELPIKRFDKKQPLPTPNGRAACFDFFCRETVTIPPGKMKPVPQNVAVQIPDGYAMLIFPRSSTALRKGLMLTNGVGVTDPFYCGDDDENLAFFLNVTDKPVTVEAGDRVVQGMIIKTESVTWKEMGSFNDNGHGGYQHLDEIKD